MLVIDGREPRWIIDELLALMPDAKIEHMAYGDYEVLGTTQRFVIERKEIGDFYKSLDDGRFWEQMEGIKRFEEFKRVLIIEGSFERLHKWHPELKLARKTGTMASLLCGFDNIAVIHTEDQRDTIDFLRRLNEKVGNGGEEAYTRSLGFTKEKRTPNQESVDILKGIDGIGEGKATDLLNEFRSVEKIARAKQNDLVKVLGAKAAEHVYRAFRQVFKSKSPEKKAPRPKPYKVVKPAYVEEPEAEVQNEGV